MWKKDSDLTVYRWTSESANAAAAKFYTEPRRCQFERAGAARKKLGTEIVFPEPELAGSTKVATRPVFGLRPPSGFLPRQAATK
jgi:hypothetical protein